MKLISPQNTVQVSGSLESSKIDMDTSEMGQFYSFLRNDIYTNKELCPQRELISNASDEHIKFNVKRPIQVHLPSASQAYFHVRDFAMGLPKEDVFLVFFKYFKSSKREDRKSIGQFGIGGLSPFALVDTFTVTSYYQGEKSVYIGVNRGADYESHLVSAEPSDEPSGIEVSFEVKEDIIYKFNQEFVKFYSHFANYAEIEVLNYNEPLVKTEVKDEEIYEESYNSSVLYKGTLYAHEYKFNNIAFKLKVPDNVILALHPSRERLVQVEVNENAIRALFDSYSKKAVDKFIQEFPTELGEQWAALSNSKVKFLHKLGLSRLKYPAMMSYATLHKSQGFKTYIIENGGYKSMKKECSVGSEIPLIYINRKALSNGMVETIEEKHPNQKRIAVVCKAHDEEDFEVIKKNITDYCSKYAAANLIDGTNYIPVRAARIKKPISDKLRVYDFGEREFRRISSKEEKETVYWTEILSKEIVNAKVIPNHMAQAINRRVEFVGVNKSNIKYVPENWRRVEPIVKSMRRYGDKYGHFDKALDNPLPYKLSPYVNITKPKTPNWPFKAKKIPKGKLAEFKKYNSFVDALHNLVYTDEELNIYIAALAGYSLESKYIPIVKQKIQEKIKKQYESV